MPFLPVAEDITQQVNQGDELEVNFRTGDIKNITTGKQIKTEPLPKDLLDIIEAGGENEFLKKKSPPQNKGLARLDWHPQGNNCFPITW